MNKPILVILAAGMGSRYGGLKQIEPVGPNGETILDYSLFDAKRAGFEKVILIIKKSIEKDIKEVMESKNLEGLDIKYAYQEIDKIPDGCVGVEDRQKPWGTAHALWCAKDLIDGPFTVVNADDFYGRQAYKTIYEHLVSNTSDCAMVAYPLVKTLSENGNVARGICQVDENGYLAGIEERTTLHRNKEGKIGFTIGENFVEVLGDTPVSMNFWGFKKEFASLIDDFLINFFKNEVQLDPLKRESYLPNAVFSLIKNNKVRVKVYNTDSKWFGVTYLEDKEMVVSQIQDLIEKGEYPN